MTKKFDPSTATHEEKRAYARRRIEEARAKGELPAVEGRALVPEVVAPQKWDASEAGVLDRFVNAVLDNGCNIEQAITVTGCPRDVASELMADPRYGPRINEIMGLRVKLQIAGKASEYAETAYGGKVLTEIFKAQNADEAATQQARQLKMGGRAARSRALIEIIKESVRQYEVLNGGHSPLPEDIAAIVASVTQQEKKSNAA